MRIFRDLCEHPRRALTMLALAAALPFASPLTHAAAPLAKTQAPGFYRLMVGELEVTALLDAVDPWPEAMDELFPALSAEQKNSLRQRTHAQPSNDFSTIAFLVNTGKKLILIDAGGGKSQPGYGQLFSNLKAAGYAPEQVDDIYITHMHPDHVFGLLDGEQRAFPNAVVHADAHELPQWQAGAAKGNKTAQAIVAKLAPYIAAKRYQPFDGDTRFSPELRAVARYGHTEGHSFYIIESRGQRLQFWGDFVVNDKVQLELPDTAPPGEKDAAQGIAMRQREYAASARSGELIAGAHFAFPGIGRLRALGSHYIWVPADYAALPASTTASTSATP
ncbi:MBL fold metallo-hydrolase [Paucibacter sp. APW11]|uniref:MBL fold metallo-hydrolase n=1 Tax=Roseateles aquae TaxID=3077235 RepID=A0ABU3PI43_9BURK|nr:MBL fold metallo-hydrolase [Paucibacter sp. APW11]MDT9002241.1 MBL fold metallo-hydrolase [Paucibacter sp. APW11]